MCNSFHSEYDQYLFHEGTHYQSYNIMGAHLIEEEEKKGVRFSVWAPNAKEVGVVGSFNSWNSKRHLMKKINSSGVWSIFIENVMIGDLYKYEIHAREGEVLLKADPYGFYAEVRPNTATKVYSLDGYDWRDREWRQKKERECSYQQPINIYEVHLGSWKQKDHGEFLSYRELARELVDYVVEMGYTHIEVLPLAEHPFDGSWGYQATGYYAVTSRYGTPHDFMYFVDQCHQKGIGVILDWVPGHFCKDDHGLRAFDGTTLYEYKQHQKAENGGWGTLNFDLEKPQVRSFLISNAIFWFEKFHIDGLRVDAVANMLYLDYGKNSTDWIPNQYGGNENLEAVDFIRKMNKAVFKYFPHALMIAEESTQWPLVTAPTNYGGLGFNYKWNMGWMNDTLRYMEMDSNYRKDHHNLLTFSFMYTFSENFILPLSHDEVVHGKRSLLNKMPGDYSSKFANLRAYYGLMMTHPGKKTLFMGGEFGQFIEWNATQGLDWILLEYDMHQKLKQYVRDLNNFYSRERCLWQKDLEVEGFQWVDADNCQQSVIAFMRKGEGAEDVVVVVINFTSVGRHKYLIGVPLLGQYQEVFNSDGIIYGGSGQTNEGILQAKELGCHNQPYSLDIIAPPLAMICLKLSTPKASRTSTVKKIE
ncbi:1,4-alpha-glucan branching enzyme [Anaerovirgula multivorans]|uniref:1,4-alpha-glucan branching enzyme GlgB n=1 Tax=Anaerovirgula multivorans TaxID=312168 RepID=A0A239K5E1_9FIRM|nr:1,4-alpha-glucan branching protein GlgB [Anaerovirgula multivorans]SNT13241.1 1,4-alpha-glucan branching enzyme [Anaerovirgula multivorans]